MDANPQKRVIKKPGLTNDKAKALDSLLQAKTTGIKRTTQYQEEKEIEEENDEQNEINEEDDFIEKDEYDYLDEEEEEFERSHVKKKVKKQNTLPIYSYMKPTTNQGQAPKIAKEAQKTKKIDENQSKDLMESLFKDYFGNNMENLTIPVSAHNQMHQQNPLENLKPTENMNQVYKSQMEKSKEDYGISVQTIKNKDIPSANPNLSAITKSPIINKTKITEELLITENPQKKSSYKNPIVAKKQEIHNETAMEEEIEEPIEQNFVENPSNNEVILERTQQKNEDLPEKIQLENEDWNEINEKSDVLFTGVLESQSKDVNDVLDEDGNILMYYYDAYEDSHAYPGIVFLFGKIQNKKTNSFESCSLMVKDIQRNVYLSPKEEVGVDFMKINQEVEEIKKKHFSRFSFSWVKQMKKKKYAFELPIPYQERDYFLIKYGFDVPALPHDLRGKTFDHAIGTTYTALELLMLKRKIRGPQWLLVKQGDFSVAKAKKSWCYYEFIIEKKKNLHVISKEMNIPPPPMKTLSFSLKTIKQESSKKQEIIMISCLFNQDFSLDTSNKSKKPQIFSLVRRLDNRPLPANCESILSKSQKNIKLLTNEYALLEFFINRVHALDPDIIIGHDLYSNLFEKILTRISDKKIGNWSRLGRLQKIAPPKGTSNLFKTRYATVGRLLCDTYLSARELVREPDYSIDHLSKVHLNLERKVIGSEYFAQAFEDQQKLIDLIESTAYDAFLTMEIMKKLEILPLTKELTTTAGNLWIKSLQNSRAERNEMLLMHEFFQNNYIFPDKFSYQHDDKNLLEDEERTEKKGKKKQKYAGGLVLEPKSGFYDKFILLLDFNSLYPSLIQEYNICFTTVQRPSISLEDQIKQKLHRNNRTITKKNDNKNNKEEKKTNESQKKNQDPNKKDEDSDEEPFENIEEMVTVNESYEHCILPKVIKSLVDKRRVVKNLLKKAENEEQKQNLDIKQKALKLIANSIYGCLGFSSSRFYAKPLAALITKRGRETLEKSVALVKDKLGYEVIYGDTDSMMINSNCEDGNLGSALQIGFTIRKEINKLSKNKKLEIDIDGVFKPLLLLRKKKYAAKKILNLGQIMMNPKIEPVYVQELKGLDMVRRDWCDLSKHTSQTILNIILSGINRDEVIFQIIDAIKKINEKLKGNCLLRDFLLTKQLTKHPNDYPGGQNLPHVVVAKRLRLNGESDANLVGHFIHYLICKGENKTLSERAFHPKEFKDKEGTLEIDIEYYKSQQIMPPITRICQHIDGVSLQSIAEALELDPHRYRSFDQNEKENIYEQIYNNNDDIELETAGGTHDKVPFQVYCPNCRTTQIYKGVWDKERKNFGIYCTCTKPFNEAILLNVISKYLKEMTDKYYEGMTLCQSENCGVKTRQIRLKDEKCPMFDCKSKSIQILQEKRIYQNFRHLKNMFDFESCISNNKDIIDIKADPQIKQIFLNCKNKIQVYLDRCVINLGNLFKFYG